jgi:hypothetical protein
MAAVVASTTDVTTPDAAMITIVVGDGWMRGPNARRSPDAVLLKSTVRMQRQNTHAVEVSRHVCVSATVLGGL